MKTRLDFFFLNFWNVERGKYRGWFEEILLESYFYFSNGNEINSVTFPASNIYLNFILCLANSISNFSNLREKNGAVSRFWRIHETTEERFAVVLDCLVGSERKYPSDNSTELRRKIQDSWSSPINDLQWLFRWFVAATVAWLNSTTTKHLHFSLFLTLF